jgi:hypothetical protein
LKKKILQTAGWQKIGALSDGNVLADLTIKALHFKILQNPMESASKEGFLSRALKMLQNVENIKNNKNKKNQMHNVAVLFQQQGCSPGSFCSSSRNCLGFRA